MGTVILHLGGGFTLLLLLLRGISSSSSLEEIGSLAVGLEQGVFPGMLEGGGRTFFSKVRYLYLDVSSLTWSEIDDAYPRNWNPSGDVKIIVHGYELEIWISGYQSLVKQKMFLIAEEYALDGLPHNVIIMDWTDYSKQFIYNVAVSNVPIAGQHLANFLWRLVSSNGFDTSDPWSRIHLVGLSLGAHVCGIAGDVLQGQYGKRVARITGLDPAGPEFDEVGGGWYRDKTKSLDKGDAAFVDIIHTNMGTPLHWASAGILGLYGSAVQSGHVDFYPNGGERQSEYCTYAMDATTGCSHVLSTRFFQQSIQNKEYLACMCGSWEDFVSGACSCDEQSESARMGEKCSSSAFGKYYLDARL